MLYSEEILKTIKSESYVSPKVEKKHFGAKGYGLIAKTEIKKDEIVSISGGLILTEKEHEKMQQIQFVPLTQRTQVMIGE